MSGPIGAAPRDGLRLDGRVVVVTGASSGIGRATFDLNAGGVSHAIRAFVPRMIAGGGGSLVVNAALSALRPRAPVGLYSAAKAAAVTLAQVAAQEAAPHGVRVNAIAPGYVRSEAWEAILGPRADALAQAVPQRRIGTTDEVAAVVAWLLSDASAYVNGVVLPIDGGLALA